jgi:hypothetical protein
MKVSRSPNSPERRRRSPPFSSTSGAPRRALPSIARSVGNRALPSPSIASPMGRGLSATSSGRAPSTQRASLSGAVPGSCGGLKNVLIGRGDCGLDQAMLNEAAGVYKEALGIAIGVGSELSVAHCLGGLSAVAAAKGRVEVAGVHGVRSNRSRALTTSNCSSRSALATSASCSQPWTRRNRHSRTAEASHSPRP